MGQIQYSEKYFDDTYEYRYMQNPSFLILPISISLVSRVR